MFFRLHTFKVEFHLVNDQVHYRNDDKGEEGGEYQAEYENKVREYQEMAQQIESQSLLLSEEKKKEKLRLLQEKATEIDQYKFEKLNPEGGEFYRKNQELFKPVIDKINLVIQKIGRVEEYDFILDASSGSILHALPKYDLTTQVLEELNRGVKSTTAAPKP